MYRAVSYQPLSDEKSLMLEPPLTVSSVRPRMGASFNANVHGARGILAFMVFCFHVVRSGLPSFSFLEIGGSPIPPLLCLQYGVEIFFCISGTIVPGALARAKSPGRFLYDRAVRILPVLWATLAIIVPLGILTHQAGYAGRSAPDFACVLVTNMFALPGVLPLPLLHMGAWSLSFEMVFYVVAMVFWWIAPHGTAAKIAAFLLAACLIAWQPRAVFFAVGAFVATNDFSRYRVLRFVTQMPLLWLVVFAALWQEATRSGADGGAGSLAIWLHDGRIAPALLAVGAATLTWCGIVHGKGILGHVLRVRPVQWLGGVSYSFYLWHLIVIAILKRLLTASGLVYHLGVCSQLSLFVLAFPASLLVAQVSATLIERRLVDWLKTRRYEAPIFAPSALQLRVTIENSVSSAT